MRTHHRIVMTGSGLMLVHDMIMLEIEYHARPTVIIDKPKYMRTKNLKEQEKLRRRHYR